MPAIYNELFETHEIDILLGDEIPPKDIIQINGAAAILQSWDEYHQSFQRIVEIEGIMRLVIGSAIYRIYQQIT